MKRKSIILVLIAILLLIGLAIYFRPLHFSVPDEIDQISIVLNEYAVSDGKPIISSAEYQATASEQKSAIRALLEKTAYRRTAGTLFSDGSMSDVGNRTLFLYIYDGDSLSDSIFVSSSDSGKYLSAPDLLLAGHYCGGVWRLPLLGAFYIPDSTLPRNGWFPAQERVQGLSAVGETQVYITGGLSINGDLPLMRFRLMNQPQISVLTLSATLPESMLSAE